MSKEKADTILVSISNNVLVVGRKRPNETVKIINAFQGEEAIELYNRLVTKKEVTDV